MQSPIAMAILKGPDFVVELANGRMYELWGKPKEQLANKPIFEGLPEAGNQGYEELLKKVFVTGETFMANGIPVNLPRESGVKTVYMNLLYEPFKESDGTISGIMAVATDVTEDVIAKHKIEEEVLFRTKELAHANESLVRINGELSRSNANLQEFAFASSHDLKEPIRKIHLFSDRLESSLEDRLTDEEKQYFQRMKMASSRMSSLIEDLLSYSQVSLTPHVLNEVDLNEVVNLTLEDLDVKIEAVSAEVIIDTLPTVNGHTRQLQQLFHNLINNALQYSKPDVAPKITISSSIVTEDTYGEILHKYQDNRYYLIEIWDNGIGFEEQYRERIFNVFTRLHSNAEYKGTGLGLAIVRKIVENHQGQIVAESQPGEGSVFKLYLPVP